jgi:nicotinamide-nucleotide amidase
MNIDFPVLIIDNIRTYFTAKKEKLAIAESVTAGFLQAAFSTAQDASLFFEGGITAYNLEQKVRHFHVDRNYAASCNCVSEKTAGEMALGVAEIFKSDWGVAITGYASPVKESGFELFAYFAIAHHKKIRLIKKINLRNQDSAEAQIEYVEKVLEELERVIMK